MTKLSARQLAAIDALTTARTIDAAAAAAGVSRMTLWRWLQNVTFCNALAAATDAAIAQSARRLAVLTAQAVDVLAAGMAGDASGGQLRAADLTLGHAARLAELYELERRIGALEARHDETRAAS